MNRAGQQGVVYQQGHGMANYAVVSAEGHAERVMDFCQLDLGAMVAAWQKATGSLRSAFMTTDAASQTEFLCKHAATQMSGYRVCLAFASIRWHQ